MIVKEVWLERLVLKLSFLSVPMYLVGIGLAGFLSPIYLVFPVTVVLTSFYLLRDAATAKLSLAFAIYQLYAVLLILIQSVTLDLQRGLLNELIRIAFPPTFFFVYYAILRKQTYSVLISLFRQCVRFAIFVLAIEAVLRVVMTLQGGLVTSWYLYKKLSPFYPDSNFAGFLLTIVLCCLYYFRDRQVTVFRGSFLATISLILLTLSRASMIAGFTAFFLNLYKRLRPASRLFVTAVGIVLITSAFGYILTDGSFKTKVNIIMIFGEWLSYPMDTVLLGIGSGNMSIEFGEESHNLFGLTVELGIIWAVVFMGTIAASVSVLGKDGLLLWIPILIPGLVSLYPITYSGLLYVVMAFMVAIKLKSKGYGHSI